MHYRRAKQSCCTLGALRDYVRVGFGTRVLLTSLVGVLLHQPPTVVLLQQVAIMWLSRADYCRCGQHEGQQ